MKNFDYYVALITATATEEAGVMHMYKDWKPLNLEGDSQKYYETALERKGKRLKLVAARQDEMGMTAAGVLTMNFTYISVRWLAVPPWSRTVRS